MTALHVVKGLPQDLPTELGRRKTLHEDEKRTRERRKVQAAREFELAHFERARSFDVEAEKLLGSEKSTVSTIKVFALDDTEWWVGESLEACLAEARRQYGDECYTDAERCQHEVSEAEMQRLIFVDDDGAGRTFAEELARRVAAGETFPQLFAAEDC